MEEHRRRLLRDPGIVRNRLKITAAINNAGRFREIQREFGSFDRYVWRFVGGKPIRNRFRTLREMDCGYADKTGLRLVHAGETVRRASEGIAATGAGLATGRGRMYGSGGRAVVEIDLDSLYDTLQGASRRGYSVEG